MWGADSTGHGSWEIILAAMSIGYTNEQFAQKMLYGGAVVLVFIPID